MNKSKINYRFVAPRTVVASIYGCEYDAISEFNKKRVFTTTSSLMLYPTENCNEQFLMPYEFHGVATCSSEDEFNWEEGKKIAYNRLADKYNASLNKHFNNIKEVFEKCILDKFWQKR